MANVFILAYIAHKTIEIPAVKNYLDAFWDGKYVHKQEAFDITVELQSIDLPLPTGIKSASSKIGKRSISYVFK